MSEGKDANGRFAKGNKAGQGNPFFAQIAKLRAELFRAVGTGDLRDILSAMTEKAKAGDVRAATLVLSYLLGRPVQHIDLTAQTTSLTPEQMRARLDELLGTTEPREE